MKDITLKVFLTIVSTFASVLSLSAAEYFVSPTGNDMLDGTTEGNAIATFQHAYSIMNPGDTLTLLDGLYDEQLYPPTTLSGSTSSYTIIRAKNIGKAVIAPSSEDKLTEGGGASASVFLYSNTSSQSSYFHIDGLFAKGIGEHSAIDIRGRDFSTAAQMTHHIRITRTGAQGSALDRNVVAFGITMSRNILVEDCYSFGPSRKPMQVFGSDNVTLRRLVLRFDWWEGDSYKPGDPRTSMSVYNTTNAILENIIVIDAGKRPAGVNSDKAALSVGGNVTPVTDNESSSNIKYLGSIAYNNLENSVGVNVNGGSGAPNSNVEFRDIILWNSGQYGVNIHANVNGVDLVNITTSHQLNSGIRLNPYPGNGAITNVSIHNSVSLDNDGHGFYYRPDANQVESFTDNSAARNSSGDDIEPEYEPTIQYLPTNIPVTGHPRGAIIENRYVDGLLTSEPLWPYPGEDLIKSKMCDPIFLQELSNIINAKDGTNITYMPGLCATSGTLTEYLWEALGNSCPAGVCDTNSPRDGQCGADNGETFSTTPTNLCTIGTPSAVSGTGPWTWTCSGSNGGNPANCSADYAPPQACTEADWSHTDGTCLATNELTRTWTVQNQTCQGGVSHPASEQVSCTYVPPATTINVRVNSSSDDAEEWIASGSMIALNSSDLELLLDSTNIQTVGIRFPDLLIPQGATISGAYLVFASYGNYSDTIDLTVNTHLTDNSATFTAANHNISGRTKSSMSAHWDTIGNWVADGSYQTPDLSDVIQEIVNRSGWSSGNAISFILTGNNGNRRAYSFDGDTERATLLHVEFTTAAAIVRADTNRDGTINAADARLTLRKSLGLDMAGTGWYVSDTTGDVNCDGHTNTADAQLILRYSTGVSMNGTAWCE